VDIYRNLSLSTPWGRTWEQRQSVTHFWPRR